MAADKFCFYVILESGEKVMWTNLTELQASRMNRATELHAPSNILKFGWGRQQKE